MTLLDQSELSAVLVRLGRIEHLLKDLVELQRQQLVFHQKQAGAYDWTRSVDIGHGGRQ